MRIFVAVDLEEEIIKKITSLIEKFGTGGFGINFVKPENLHFTVKFLGEVEEGRLEEIKEKIEEAVKNIKKFEIEIKGVGFFGSEKFIRVLWIGLEKGKEQMIDLIDRVNKSLDYIRKDEFRPSPHLTFGRVVSGKNREKLLEVLKKSEKTDFGKMIVKEIKLKQSVLGKGGPTYSDLAVFKLGD